MASIRLYLLLGLMFAIVYEMIAAVAGSMGISSFAFYGVLASGMILVNGFDIAIIYRSKNAA